MRGTYRQTLLQAAEYRRLLAQAQKEPLAAKDQQRLIDLGGDVIAGLVDEVTHLGREVAALQSSISRLRAR